MQKHGKIMMDFLSTVRILYRSHRILLIVPGTCGLIVINYHKLIFQTE